MSAALLTSCLAIGALIQAARVALRWRIGRPADVAWGHGLLSLPKRYLVDVHRVVARDAYAARMHALAAGGLVAGVCLLLVSWFPVPPLYWAAPALAFMLAIIGGAMAGARRLPRPPPRLSRGRFQYLPWLLTAFATGGMLGSLSLATRIGPALPAFLLMGFAGLALLAEIRVGPLKHVVAGVVHLIAHPRPSRFSGRRAVALVPLDLAAQRLGIGDVGDFAWPSLAGIDACIQCGRCEIACPAFAAGMPLNPKKFIQDIAASLGPGTMRYAGSPHPGTAAAQTKVQPETLWSCTTCRACVEECPMMIEHVDAIIGMRRYETLERGAVPEKVAAALDELRYADNPGGRRLEERIDFAAGIDLPIAREDVEIDTLLWLGDGAFDLRYGRTLRAITTLLAHAGVDFAVLGAAERDCGDLARRLGDEAVFQRLAHENIATLARYRFRRIATADPHAYHVLKNEYKALGGNYDVIHHTTLLAELLACGRLVPARTLGQDVTYHDPCYLGRYGGEFEAPRTILREAGLNLVEMARSGPRSMCCGAGGGAALSDMPAKRRIPDLRMAQALETGASIVAVACPNCTAMLEGVTGAKAKIVDVAELLMAAMEPE